MNNDIAAQILSMRDDPEALEQLYRTDPAAFEASFHTVFAAEPHALLIRAWGARLASPLEAREPSAPEEGGRLTLGVVIALCAFSGTVAKLPAWFDSIDAEKFYTRNLPIVVLASLAAYFTARRRQSWPRLVAIASAFLVGGIVINSYPSGPAHRMSDSVALACLHLPLFLWTIVGVAFAAADWRQAESRIAYLRFNGEMLITAALIQIAGTLMTGITIALFSVIGLNISKWYVNWVVVYGGCSLPIVATHLAISRGRRIALAPIIARIFSPLALATLIVYLVAMAVQRHSPYADREFLLVFNVMLVCVLGIAVFCISQRRTNRFFDLTIWALVCVALIIDGVALSAILLRLASYGFSPNRTVTLVTNVLVLANLVLILVTFTRPAVQSLPEAQRTKRAIAGFLPVYSAWAGVVACVLPFLFGFR